MFKRLFRALHLNYALKYSINKNSAKNYSPKITYDSTFGFGSSRAFRVTHLFGALKLL